MKKAVSETTEGSEKSPISLSKGVIFEKVWMADLNKSISIKKSWRRTIPRNRSTSNKDGLFLCLLQLSDRDIFGIVQLFMEITLVTAGLLPAFVLWPLQRIWKTFKRSICCGFLLFRCTHLLCLCLSIRKKGFLLPLLFHNKRKRPSQPNSSQTMMILFGCPKQHKVFQIGG